MKQSPPQNLNSLETSVQYCPGVGPRRAQMLQKLGVITVRDLFWLLPRGYEDFHNVKPIHELIDGEISTVLGKIVSLKDRVPYRKSRVRHIIEAVIEDKSGKIAVTWFNQKFLMNQINHGDWVRLHGKCEAGNPLMQMKAPKIFHSSAQQERSLIVPIYPLTEGITQGVLQKIIRQIFDRFADDLHEFLPETLVKKYTLMSRKEAFRILHTPAIEEKPPLDTFSLNSNTEYEEITPWQQARKRLVFEEFFIHQLLLRLYHQKIKRHKGIAHPLPQPNPWTASRLEINYANRTHWPAAILHQFPFELTPDQKTVCHEIEADMQKESPMNRLLQGDVGSGKTVVSLYAMMIAAAGKTQAVLMAPTEILARQHALSIRQFTQKFQDICIVELYGSTSLKERRETLQLIESGTADIIVGTHALFQEAVHFSRLGLVVIDEQHKFGVEQRQQLVDKGEYPDLLVATATPIPRTLTLTLFGNMDISTIKTMPPNRPPLITRWTYWEKEDKVWKFVDEKIEQGQQAYVVCPIIEPSEEMPHLPSTEEAFEKLSQKILPHRRVALLHGQHSAQEKSERMRQIQAGKIDLVVATTVIEVGVDLPNATLMVILGADRFGLSQLHQLRGRVGRGRLESYCVLITQKRVSQMARERMKAMEKTRDGFEIAEMDLNLRGPGEQFGTRQSGHAHFLIADASRDMPILNAAHEASRQLFKADPSLKQRQHQLLRAELKRVFESWSFHRPS